MELEYLPGKLTFLLIARRIRSEKDRSGQKALFHAQKQASPHFVIHCTPVKNFNYERVCEPLAARVDIQAKCAFVFTVEDINKPPISQKKGNDR